MNEVLHSTERYLANLIGKSPNLTPDTRASSRLPMFLSQMYAPFTVRLFGRDVLLMLWKRTQKPTPGEVASHAQQVKKFLQEDQPVFVFPALAAYDRNRLMQHGLAFIVPDRQIFFPPRIIDLRESSYSGIRIVPVAEAYLSAPTQALLLYYLQKSEVGQLWALHEWAVKLGYSRMTITRVCRELEKNELCKPTGRGRSITPIFEARGRALWERAKPLLRNPIERVAHVLHYSGPEPEWVESGINALANYSALAESSERIVALSTSAYRAAREKSQFEEQTYGEQGALTVEQWRYPPALLSPDHRSVDRLSLYLAFREDPDERVQSALETMLEGIKW